MIMNTVTVPIIDYKMDKVKLIIIVIAIVLLFLIAFDGGSIIRSIIDGVGNAISGIGKGVVNGISDLTGVNQQYAVDDAYSARIDKYWTGNTWVNWMQPDLYNSDPSQVTINETIAKNLYQNIRSAEGNKIFGVIISNGDMSGIQQDFSNVVGNKFDISYVSYIANQSEGISFGQICEAPQNFYNDSVGSSGESNLQMLADFLDWANNLPTY